MSKIRKRDQGYDSTNELWQGQVVKAEPRLPFKPRFPDIASSLSGVSKSDLDLNAVADENGFVTYRVHGNTRDVTFPLRVVEDTENIYLETPVATVVKGNKAFYSELLFLNNSLALGTVSLSETVPDSATNRHAETVVMFGGRVKKRGISHSELCLEVSTLSNGIEEISNQVRKRAEVTRSVIEPGLTVLVGRRFNADSDDVSVLRNKVVSPRPQIAKQNSVGGNRMLSRAVGATHPALESTDAMISPATIRGAQSVIRTTRVYKRDERHS